MLANIAYFAGASKEEIKTSGRLVASLLFRNVYGPKVERGLSVFVALSALGNVLSVVGGFIYAGIVVWLLISFAIDLLAGTG